MTAALLLGAASASLFLIFVGVPVYLLHLCLQERWYGQRRDRQRARLLVAGECVRNGTRTGQPT